MPEIEKINKLDEKFKKVRNTTIRLISPLKKEDMVVQCGKDASPIRWHLAHTTWFFEKFVLKKYVKNYREFNKSYDFLFNSYYETVGSFFPKILRGTQSRPDIDEILEYRKFVEESVEKNRELFERKDIRSLMELGINHEQQHQELMLMDVKYNFYNNPTMPEYIHNNVDTRIDSSELEYLHFNGGLYNIGYSGGDFSFDNETPKHKAYLEKFQISSRLITNGEYLGFIESGGYEKPELWLSDGWQMIKKDNVKMPLYWLKKDDELNIFNLDGLKPLNPHEPVSHLSYYEADAYASWVKKRLPREEEWKVAFGTLCPSSDDNFMESGIYHPTAMKEKTRFQALGDLWEWTMSPYTPYPGSKPLSGSVGEYNHKFMSGQMVLRGGSCVTPGDHMRPTYRNFFSPQKRWMFSGLRLAGDD